MVGTRAQNKTARPAAPVMTKAAKKKAGIPTTTRRTKKQANEDKMRQMEARLAMLENPDDATPVSKDPLFTRGSSPPDDEDAFAAKSETPTEPDTEEYVVVGGKRVPSTSNDPRALKRTYAFDPTTDARPTVRNKPSGLVNNWPRLLVDTGPTVYQRPTLMSPASSSAQFFPPSPSPSMSAWHQQTLMDPSSPNMFQHPDMLQHSFQAVPPPNVVYSLPRRVKDKAGKIHVPGVRDLPPHIQSGFRNIFIRRIMKLTFSSDQPWSNPDILIYQQEFNNVYPQLQYRLHVDDAVVVPTNRDLSVLRNQIGKEGLTAVIEHLPTLYDKRSLSSKAARAHYIDTILGSPQKPYIWEMFRPGTIPIPRGEELYYDEKRRGKYQSIPVLRAFSVYYSSSGIQQEFSLEESGHPVGALALVAAAVERGYEMHRTGDYVSSGKEFSATNCIRATTQNLANILKLTDNDWKGIYQALQRLEETLAHEARIKAGAMEEEDEGLLSDDPPTSPPAA